MDTYIFAGNLHAGNVFMASSGSPNISEIESYVMGATSILRNYIVQLKGPSSSLEALDVYCFGHLIFEMATGHPLNNATCDNALPTYLQDQLSRFFYCLILTLVHFNSQGICWTICLA